MKHGVYRFFKRLLDIVLAFIALLIIWPVMLVLAIWVKCDSKGPVIFRQSRVGMHGKLFRIYKFRTMRTDAPSEKATKDLENPYSYITKSGDFLRKTSLDELPQLINVIKGDMSLVGPRPLIENEGGDIHKLRMDAGVYTVRPGLTGYAQVYGKYNTTPYDKLQMDLMYISRQSILEDLNIILATQKKMMS